jgi:integrase
MKPDPDFEALVCDATMRLRVLFEKSFVPHRRAEGRYVHGKKYLAAISQLGAFLQHDPIVGDLRHDVFLPFYVHAFSAGLYRATLLDYRLCLYALWRYAATRGLIPEPSSPPPAIPRAPIPMEVTGAPAPAGTVRDAYQRMLRPHVVDRWKRSWRIKNDAAICKFYLFCGGDIAVDAVTDSRLCEFKRWMTEVRGHCPSLAEQATACIRRIMRVARPEAFPRKYKPAWNRIDEPETAEMSVRWYFNERYLPAHSIRPATEVWYRTMLRHFDRWLGRDAMLTDLNRIAVNNFLQAIQDQYAPKSVHGFRRAILTIWRAAFDDELLVVAPRSIRRITVPPPMPEAWTINQVQRLIEATRAERFDRAIGNGIRVGQFMEALIRVCYDTALRLGDLESLDWRGVRADGTIVVRMEKTGHIKTCQITPASLAAAERIRVPNDDRVLPWSAGRRRFYIWWWKLIAEAGFEVNRRNGPQKLRRTSATFVELMSVGMATAHLGHRSADLAKRHYIDPALAYKPTLPPAIPESPTIAAPGEAAPFSRSLKDSRS